jgi:hypothetical protein
LGLLKISDYFFLRDFDSTKNKKKTFGGVVCVRLGFGVFYRMAERTLDVHFDNGKSVSSDFCATLLTFVREERGPQLTTPART